jgi:hypothetical protein
MKKLPARVSVKGAIEASGNAKTLEPDLLESYPLSVRRHSPLTRKGAFK